MGLDLSVKVRGLKLMVFIFWLLRGMLFRFVYFYVVYLSREYEKRSLVGVGAGLEFLGR